MSGAVPFDPARCILGRAMDCLIDNVVMQFRSTAEARAVASATGMARVDRVSVALPRFVAAVGIAFDSGMLGPRLRTDDWELIRRETFEPLAARTNEFTAGEIVDAMNGVRTARGMEPRRRLSLRGASAGGADLLSRELACRVYERNLVSLRTWVEMRFADRDEAARVARATGEERYEPGRTVSLPTPLVVLYAALELGTPRARSSSWTLIEGDCEGLDRRIGGHRHASAPAEEQAAPLGFDDTVELPMAA